MDRMETLLYLLGSTCNFIQGYFFFKTRFQNPQGPRLVSLHFGILRSHFASGSGKYPAGITSFLSGYLLF